MKESHSEERANHTDPESCGYISNGVAEALTGESAGQLLSCDIRQLGEPTLLGDAEGNISGVVIRETFGARRSRRP